LSEKYAVGALSVSQCADILGVDEGEAMTRLAQPRRKGAQPWQVYRASDDDEADISAALGDVAGGATVDLTPDELASWEATGELPASVEARFAGCG